MIIVNNTVECFVGFGAIVAACAVKKKKIFEPFLK